jgi:prolyl 4-hydroxylase
MRDTEIPALLAAQILQDAFAGRAPEELIQPLITAGWDSDAAVGAVEQLVRTRLEQHARENALPLPKRVPGPAGLNATSLIEAGDRRVQVIANLLYPRVILFGGLLSEAECQALILAATPRLKRSTVVHSVTGADQTHDARTSEGASFTRGETPLCRTLDARISALLDWPIEFGEGLQVLRYAVGAEYKPHYDYFDPADAGNTAQLARGGQRVATLVMYLNTPESGGATTFPDARFEAGAIQGNAVFFSYDRPHPMTGTLHGGAPVHAGEKWIATKWLRESEHH